GTEVRAEPHLDEQVHRPIFSSVAAGQKNARRDPRLRRAERRAVLASLRRSTRMISDRSTAPIGRAGDHWIHIEESPRHVRVKFGGEIIADSRHAMLLREKTRTPVYYFPPGDVGAEAMRVPHHLDQCPHKGDATYSTMRVGADVAWQAP